MTKLHLFSSCTCRLKTEVVKFVKLKAIIYDKVTSF